jgi:hypothetical protein
MSAILVNVWWRNGARIWRSTIPTAFSTLALSLGWPARAGTIATP